MAQPASPAICTESIEAHEPVSDSVTADHLRCCRSDIVLVAAVRDSAWRGLDRPAALSAVPSSVVPVPGSWLRSPSSARALPGRRRHGRVELPSAADKTLLSVGG